MNRVDAAKMRAAAEGLVENVLSWQIALPTPWTTVSEVVKLAIAVAAGALLL